MDLHILMLISPKFVQMLIKYLLTVHVNVQRELLRIKEIVLVFVQTPISRRVLMQSVVVRIIQNQIQTTLNVYVVQIIRE